MNYASPPFGASFGNSKANGGCLKAPRHEVSNFRADPFTMKSTANPLTQGEK